MSDPIGPSDIGRLGRELTARDHERTAPPPEVWDGIERALGDAPAPGGTILSFGGRTPRTPHLLVAAAVLLLAGLAGLFVLQGGGDDQSVVAEVAITDDGLEVTAPADGRAKLVETDDGLEVDLELPALPETDGFYEAWLIDPAIDGMYSLGAVGGGGRLTVPAGVDVAAHPIIDISVEPLDGDPTHSGRSVLRGSLTL